MQIAQISVATNKQETQLTRRNGTSANYATACPSYGKNTEWPKSKPDYYCNNFVYCQPTS